MDKDLKQLLYDFIHKNKDNIVSFQDAINKLKDHGFISITSVDQPAVDLNEIFYNKVQEEYHYSYYGRDEDKETFADFQDQVFSGYSGESLPVFRDECGSVALCVKKGPFDKASAFYLNEGDIIIRMERCC